MEFEKQKGEKPDQLTARIIKERAKGRCEYTWYQNDTWHRCRELHGEPAINFNGFVHLQLMPTAGLNDRRVSNLKVYCQKHAYQLLASIAANVTGVVKRNKETNPAQVGMFENHALL